MGYFVKLYQNAAENTLSISACVFFIAHLARSCCQYFCWSLLLRKRQTACSALAPMIGQGLFAVRRFLCSYNNFGLCRVFALPLPASAFLFSLLILLNTSSCYLFVTTFNSLNNSVLSHFVTFLITICVYCITGLYIC